MATARVVSKSTHAGSTPCAWGSGRTWAGTIQQHLTWTGWRSTAQWQWYHHGIGETISLDSTNQHWHSPKRLGHILREAWRRHKADLENELCSNGAQYAAVFIFVGKEMPTLQQLDRSTLELISKWKALQVEAK